MAEIDPDVVAFWGGWAAKWHRRIDCLAASQSSSHHMERSPRPVRASQIVAAWKRMFMPAVDPEYVMPEWWLALSADEKRASQPPVPILRPKTVAPASERGPGFSLDDVGPYFKLPDGTVFRDRAAARDRLWREERRYSGFRQIIAALPARTGRGDRVVRGRTPDRVLDALVSFGLVHAGMTRIGAAELVLSWRNEWDQSAKKYADESTKIWRELRLPPVRPPVSE